jgi:alanine racemase
MNTAYRPISRCWAEVDLNALRENLAWVRAQVGPEIKIMTIVKADAYGHGLRQIAATLMQSGTDVFGVANLVEAQNIRSVGQGWPVLMLGAALPQEVDYLVRDGIMPTLSTLEEAQRFSASAIRRKQTVAAHLKVDTGMGRIGVLPEKTLDLIKEIQALPGLQLQGLYTHYASVEDDAEYSRKQRAQFRALVQTLSLQGIQVPWIHANNSGALLHEPDTQFNLIRPGLMVYGVIPHGDRMSTSNLQRVIHPVLAWKCRISFVKMVEPGTAISYGRTFTASQPMRVATLTAGYGDGYLRAASNRAQVLIRGHRCRVLGRITMDQMMVDVSEVGGAAVGDEVVLIGGQGDQTITAAELAEWMGTIPWEVFTSITYRVPRLYLGTHAA